MPLRPPVVRSRVTKGVGAMDSGEMWAGTLDISTDASKVSTDTRTNPASTCQIDWGPRTMERPQRQQLGRLEANRVPLAWRTRSGGFLSHHPPTPESQLPSPWDQHRKSSQAMLGATDWPSRLVLTSWLSCLQTRGSPTNSGRAALSQKGLLTISGN